MVISRRCYSITVPFYHMFRYLLIPLRYTFIILTILIYLQKVIVKLLTNIANILIYILQRKKKKKKDTNNQSLFIATYKQI